MLLLFLVLGAAAMALQSAVVRLLARDAPDLALRISPGDSMALAAKANLLLAASVRDPAQSAAARRMAQSAIMRDLTRDDALLVLAATTSGAGAERRALPLLYQAQTLSRRNLPVQMWLIEESVRNGNVAGALYHFDVALRTSNAAGPILFPVLRNAIEDRGLTRDIARTLNAAPWRGAFLQYAVSLNQPSAALAAVVGRQRGLEPFQGVDLKASLVAQLATAKLYDEAGILALGRAARLVQDPAFASDRGYPPFTWQLSGTSGLTARRLRENANSLLEVQADDGAVGTVAAQIIHAPPGSYTLVATLAEQRPGLSVRLACADSGRELTRIDVDQARGRPVAIPPGCPFQNLNIVAQAPEDGSASWRLFRLELIPN